MKQIKENQIKKQKKEDYVLGFDESFEYDKYKDK